MDEDGLQNLPPGDLAILVTDPEHQRFGHLARVNSDLTKNLGALGITFTDGTHTVFPDALFAQHCSIQLFYRKPDAVGRALDESDSGPVSLLRNYLGLNPEGAATFRDQYQALFGEAFKA